MLLIAYKLFDICCYDQRVKHKKFSFIKLCKSHFYCSVFLQNQSKDNLLPCFSIELNLEVDLHDNKF